MVTSNKLLIMKPSVRPGLAPGSAHLHGLAHVDWREIGNVRAVDPALAGGQHWDSGGRGMVPRPGGCRRASRFVLKETHGVTLEV